MGQHIGGDHPQDLLPEPMEKRSMSSLSTEHVGDHPFHQARTDKRLRFCRPLNSDVKKKDAFGNIKKEPKIKMDKKK